jgi:hypothetical protein
MLEQPVPSKPITDAMLDGLKDEIYPQQLYTLGVKDLKAKNIGGAKLSGWRFTGKLAGRDMCVHVGHHIRSKSPAVSRLSYGPYVTKAREAMKKIVKSPEVRAHNYELRLLSIPALSVEAVWLKSQTGKHDLMVPYLPAAGLRSMRFYPLDKFLTILQPKAQERLMFDDSPSARRRG